jgi:hypothetical protein
LSESSSDIVYLERLRRAAEAKRLQEGIPVERRDPLAAYKERKDAVVTEPEVVF